MSARPYHPATAVSPAKAAAILTIPTPALTAAGDAFTLCSWARALWQGLTLVH